MNIVINMIFQNVMKLENYALKTQKISFVNTPKHLNYMIIEVIIMYVIA